MSEDTHISLDILLLSFSISISISFSSSLSSSVPLPCVTVTLLVTLHAYKPLNLYIKSIDDSLKPCLCELYL